MSPPVLDRESGSDAPTRTCTRTVCRCRTERGPRRRDASHDQRHAWRGRRARRRPSKTRLRAAPSRPCARPTTSCASGRVTPALIAVCCDTFRIASFRSIARKRCEWSSRQPEPPFPDLPPAWLASQPGASLSLTLVAPLLTVAPPPPRPPLPEPKPLVVATGAACAALKICQSGAGRARQAGGREGQRGRNV